MSVYTLTWHRTAAVSQDTTIHVVPSNDTKLADERTQFGVGDSGKITHSASVPPSTGSCVKSMAISLDRGAAQSVIKYA